MPSGGGQPLQATQSGGEGALESPDGNIYYVRNRVLYKMPVGGGKEKQVLPFLSHWVDFAVSANGIYFISPDRKELQFLDTATGKVSTRGSIDRPVGGICVSPDGAYVLWAQTDRDTTDLMLVENFR